MNIIVVGCGKIGTTILASLVAEGHDIVAIDENPDVLTEIANIYDVMGVCGNGANCEILDEAGVDKAQMFVAVTESDELNMLSCFLARKMGAQHTIARIRNPEYNAYSRGFIKQQLELSMAINPEKLAAQEIYNVLKLPSAAKVENFSMRNLEMVEFRIRQDSKLDGLSVSRMREKYKAEYLVCTVQRGDQVYIPDGNFKLKSGDKIGITAAPVESQKLLKMLGVQQKQAKNVMILGGSRIAYYLAQKMGNIGSTVKIIEKDAARCAQLSNLLPKATVIHGDGALQELLLEEGIRSMDAFVALTGMDEENILISLFASMQNVPKVMPKINRDELAPMAQKLDLESIISPRQATANILVRYARALENSMGSNVETLYKLVDGKAEALEFNVRPGLRLLDVPLKELKLKENVLIAGIMRGRKTILPSGDDVILAGDRVIVLAAGQRLRDLADIQA